MASISPYKSGYRAQIFLLGTRESKTFRTKREATVWAAQREAEIRRRGSLTSDQRYLLRDLLDDYLEKVVPRHKAHVREAAAVKAIKNWMESAGKLDTPLTQAKAVIEEYRDTRLEIVSDPTVLREIKIFGTAFETAKEEWNWIDENPVRSIWKPSSNPHRDRTITWSEIRGMLRQMKYPAQKRNAALVFLMALRTGMRAGELCNLTWDRVSEKSVFLDKTKTKPREVPLSKKARRILDMARGRYEDRVFGIKETSLSGTFIQCKRRAGYSGFRFHDSRHTAATWMAKKVDVLTLCKIFGWTDPKMAMVYFNPKSSDIADML